VTTENRDQPAFAWGIETLTFCGGDAVGLPRNALTILIGPNNSGKSTALANLFQQLTGESTSGRVVETSTHFAEGYYDDIRIWLDQNYGGTDDGAGHRVWQTVGGTLFSWSIEPVRNLPRRPTLHTVREIRPFVVHHLGVEQRLADQSASSIALFQRRPEAYIHVLQMNDNLLEQVSQEVREAFGEGIVINRAGGAEVWLHFGREPPRTHEADRVSESYVRALSDFPRLGEQGDGVRSFISCLLASECGAHKVLLIDEPEAFLHPPQIRRLGRLLARSAEQKERQIIVATHSSDFVQAALTASGRASVCRITRTGPRNHVIALAPDRLAELWKKPLLRSAAAIDGVFHLAVVVCEADSDSRFYEAILRRLGERKRVTTARDLYFIQGGGKGELSTLARVYRELEVPVAAIADLDMLRNEGEFKKLFTMLGGDFETWRSIYTSTVSALADLGARLPLEEFLASTRATLQNVQTKGIISTDDRRKLTELVEDTATWSQAKRYGIFKLRGGSLTGAKRLWRECSRLGLFLVPVGVLEGWWLEGPASDKTEWFHQAIERVATEPDSFHRAEMFVAEVARFLGMNVTLDTTNLLEN